MTYQEALQAAKEATTYEEVDALLKAIEEAYDTISDRQYYNVRNIAINAAYAAQEEAAHQGRKEQDMEIDTWVDGYKVRAFPWVDGKRIYFNVQYYAPGQSIAKPPAWDKTVYITDNAAGQRLVNEFTHSLAELVAQMQIADHTEITLTA